MSASVARNDRKPAVPDWDPGSTLAGALARLQLRGAIFLRGEYSEAWAYESLPPTDAAAVLAPGAQQVLLFHVIASGRCWVETPGGERHWASAGDVVVLPYNHEHKMGGRQPAECVPVATLIDDPPWERMPVIHHGQGGAPTRVVCGYLTCDDPLFDPRLRLFPPLFVVRPTGSARDWVRASIDYALQQTAPVEAERIEAPTRLPELLLIEMLRLHLASAPAAAPGWFTAIRDPVLAPALAAMHGAPERRWTVAGLARAASTSESVLDERFREVLGLAPIRYLTGWRMHVAQDLLQTSDLSVAAVARRVGYDSEEAFSRAFKRAHGLAPSVWRVRKPR